MNRYDVWAEMTVAVCVTVEAENEDEARAIAEDAVYAEEYDGAVIGVEGRRDEIVEIGTTLPDMAWGSAYVEREVQ